MAKAGGTTKRTAKAEAEVAEAPVLTVEGLLTMSKIANKMAVEVQKALDSRRLAPGSHAVDVCLRLVGTGVQAKHSEGKEFTIDAPAYSPTDILAGLLLSATGGELSKVDAQIRAAIVALPKVDDESAKAAKTLQALATIREVMEARIRDLQLEMPGYCQQQSGKTAGKAGAFTCAPLVAIAATPEGLRGLVPKPVEEVLAGASGSGGASGDASGGASGGEGA